MNNRAYLKQARIGIKKLIAESPLSLVVARDTADMVDDGTGNLVQNPFAVSVSVTITARVSHEATGTFELSETPAGLGTALGRYILVDYETTIKENDEVSADGRTYKIGPVDPLRKFGGIIGYQAALIEVV